MQPEHRRRIGDLRARICAPPPRVPVSDWCERNVIIPPPQTQSPGPLSWVGREYLREPLNAWNMPGITDIVLAFGSQSGKTTMLQAGAVWLVVCSPTGVLWVMPSQDLARSFSETRMIPIFRATGPTSELIPTGRDRHAFKKLQQQIGGSVLTFVGSNSPANLASRPARVVILDEVDKFDDGGKAEADAVTLAEQRTKSFARPLRVKTSTPTLADGLIWKEFLKGDQRRYFMPCPSCDKHVVFAWSPTYTIMPKTGAEAWVKWDKEARDGDGRWDLDRVHSSAHALCPHCGAKIRDDQKTAMLRRGEWRPTAHHSHGFRSYHLPSMYAVGPQTSFGSLAVQFLRAHSSIEGVQGFVNGALAEPWESQDTSGGRTELISERLDVGGDGWVRVLTVDCQAKAPFFWWVVREWKAGDSRGIAWGSAHEWSELEEIQRKYGVRDEAVAVDSGWGAKSDAEVYAACARHCDAVARPAGRKPLAVGWMPTKGFPGRRKWRDEESGILRPLYTRDVDPFEGSAHQGQIAIGLVGFSADYFKDVLAALRKRQGDKSWSVTPQMASDTYWHHLDAEHLVTEKNRTLGTARLVWRLRASGRPNHLLDCEVLQLVVANYVGLFEIESQQEQEKTNEQHK